MVKTRLVPPLTSEEAAALNICFLRDMTANIAGITRSGGADGVIVYTPVGAESAYDGLLPEGFSLLAQRGASLGDRLLHAAEDLLAVGYNSLCLIDSDSPTLPGSLLRAAVAALKRPGARVALGAADDGGYYLIGLKHAHRRLFEDVDWSTARVLRQTIERAAEINLAVELLPAWYDVDEASSLRRLCEELFAKPDKPDGRDYRAGYDATYTRDYLARLIGAEGRSRIWPEAQTRRGQKA
jgi:rSAM/selenodomain-associated transferase 1